MSELWGGETESNLQWREAFVDLAGTLDVVLSSSWPLASASPDAVEVVLLEQDR